ncbi:rhodanese-like domain-containing protein [Acetobacterium bakii]|nr:rhodanese-like domain-containing protein [Acetobacterium bakii]
MYKKITAQEAKSIIDSREEVIILDVRTQKEFDEGYIENAVLIPHTEIENQAPGVLTDKNAKILVYCRTGSRSAVAAKKLAEMGYANVYDFGGIVDWPYGVVVK